MVGHNPPWTRGENVVKEYGLYIGGEWAEPHSGDHLDSVDPYRGEVWARIARGDASDVARAVDAAGEALESGPWGSMSASNRGGLMRRLADLIVANTEKLAEIEVRDN